jgi:hypothetical protein
MSALIDEFVAADKRIPMRELIAGLQETLQRNHLKILAAARSDWERKRAGQDPSDACVTVRIAPQRKTKKRAPKAAVIDHWQSLS